VSAAAAERLAWPLEHLGEAIAALARRGDLTRSVQKPPPPGAELSVDRGALARWVGAACRSMGFEAERVQVVYRELDEVIRGSAPALVRLPGDGVPTFVALAGGERRGSVLVIGPDHRPHRLAIADLRAALCRELEATLGPNLEKVMAVAEPGGSDRKRLRTREALLGALSGADSVGDLFMLRLSPGASLLRQLVDSRLVRVLVSIAAGQALQYLLLLGSWWMIGRGALGGRLDSGWVAAWALLVTGSSLVRLYTIRKQGTFAIAGGALVRQRLLKGALSVSQDEVRRQGTGQLLGQVLESEALESLGLTGGLLSLEAGIQLAIAPFVLWAGAGGPLHAGLLVVWVVGTVALGVRYHRARTRWTEARVAMTNDLVELLIGHRTRVAQEPIEAKNQEADANLAHYVGHASAMDREGTRFRALVARGWLVAGMAGIGLPFVSGSAAPASLAIGLGGVILAYRALGQLATGMVSLSGAAIAFRQIAPLHEAAGRAEAPGLTEFAVTTGTGAKVEVHDLTFRYHQRGDQILSGVSLEIAPGDRILLEGPSGGGKSTFAAVLAGLRKPESGVVLLGGLDFATLGAETWRRRVVTAPQFQENHLLIESFQFNLLMGCESPPTRQSLREAEAICAELGLGTVLSRMPSGMLQVVGETGWQLSHGERSRVYIARALLQNADLVILDENFGALDPENLERALRCVLARARSLLVIAHP